MRAALVLAVLFSAGDALAATTLRAGPGRPYATPCAAIAAAQPGDTIEVDAGRYDGDTCAWSTDDLTVRGVGGRAIIDLTGVTPAQQKGIFTISAPNATLESLELSGAAISAAAGNNGAGIRHQGLNLTVRDCYLHDNQNGILGSPSTDGQGQVTIERSELSANGAGDGFSHNLYLGGYASFTLLASYSHGAKVGHLVKSRARKNLILYNRITDESGTTASYEIDLPNGGRSTILGNVIQQAATSQNPTIITSGEEGATNPEQRVEVVSNTIVNDRASGTFVNLAAGTTALLQNNIFRGPGTITSLAAAMRVANWDDSMGDPRLVDFHLGAGSPCVDRGLPPSDMALLPAFEYVHVASSQPRVVSGAALDIGAFERGAASSVDAGVARDASPVAVDAPPVAVDAPPRAADASSSDAPPAAEPSSSGCSVGRRGSGGLLVAAAAALALALRRRRSASSSIASPAIS